MPRATQTWLMGPDPGGRDSTPAGVRLGLPAQGPGSVAPVGRRVAAFLVDTLAGFLIGGLADGLLGDPTPLQRSLVANAGFALIYLVLVPLTGQTLGMRLLGLRLRWLPSDQRPPGLLPTALRTALLMLLLPAVVSDRDGRGLHDKAAKTVVVRA